jgi:hypothetical protein
MTTHSHHARNHKSTGIAYVDARRLDVESAIRKHPLPAIATAAAVGATLGITLGSRIMRMIIASVGMYTLTDVLQQWTKGVLAETRRST